MKHDEVAEKVVALIADASDADTLHQILNVISYTVGGLILHFEQDDRTNVLIQLSEAMAKGLMNTSMAIGEPCDVEMLVSTG